MSLFLRGSGLIGSSGSLLSSSSGSGPAAPVNPTAVLGSSGTDAFVIFGAPQTGNTGGAAGILYYTATAHGGPSAGTTGTSPWGGSTNNQPSGPGPINILGGTSTTFNSAVSCRCDISGLAAGNYTFTVTATNASGTSVASASSNQITVASLINPYYLADGVTGAERTGWGVFNAPGTWNDTTHVFGGQSFALKLNASDNLTPYYIDPVGYNGSTAGIFDVTQYGYLTFQVYCTDMPTSNGLQLYHRGRCNVYGQATSATTTGSMVDAYQNWNANQFIQPNDALLDVTKVLISAGGQAPSSNSGTTIVVSGGSPNASFASGDFYAWTRADYDYPLGVNVFLGASQNIAYVNGGAGFTLNAWNLVKVPLSAFGISQPPEGMLPNFIQETGFIVLTANPIWLTNYGYTT